jgi:hypothetical protein
MIYQYDHHFDSYKNATQANLNAGILPQTSDAEKSDPSFHVLPRYWVPGDEVETRLANWPKPWLLGFRDITSSVVERTSIFSVLPRVGVGNKFPLLIFDEALESLTCCLLANVNSIVFDYCTRQKIAGNSLNYFILKQLPVLPPTTFQEWDVEYVSRRVYELVYTAHDLHPWAELLGYQGGPFCFDSKRRALLAAELDAEYAHLYGLTRDELRYVLDPKDLFGENFPSETFRVLKEREIKEYGEYRTRRLVLAAYDELAKSDRFRDEIPHRVSAIKATPTTVKARSHS